MKASKNPFKVSVMKNEKNAHGNSHAMRILIYIYIYFSLSALRGLAE